ncbi:MAG: alpha/beta hydrolase [Chloroflexota bacterium]
MTFDKIYHNVPAEQRKALKAFRQDNPHKSLIVNKIEWTYYSLVQGEKTILWLVGGLKKADAAYKSIPMLSEQYRIIAPDYPALSTMGELADGLAGILDVEGIEQVYVLAGSFGGMLAQVFLRAYPERVAKIVLSTTTVPDASHIERYQQLLGMAQVAPDDLLAKTAQTQMFSTIAPADNDADFYHAYLKELYEQRLAKTDIVTIYQAIIDFMGQSFAPDDMSNWDGEILIINSDNDATFGATVQHSLFNLYPDAIVHTFEGAGHSPASTQREAFFERVEQFFAG